MEDVGAPSLARTVGRVVEVFPDGTSQLQLQRSPEGTFGFCVASGNGRRDSGISPPLSGLHRPVSLANHSGALWLWSEASSGLWLSSGALDSENLLLEGLGSSPQGVFLESHGVELLEGAAAVRLHTTVPLLSADILSIRILKASFSLESKSGVFALASSQGRSL